MESELHVIALFLQFLGGRVIFVEVAKPKSELGRSSPPDSESFDLNINKH
jgi:hypothetical protein